MKEIKDNQKIKGKLHIVLRGENGNIKQEQFIDNTITNLFDAHVADRMSESGDTAIGFMSIGSGTGQTSASTDLSNHISTLALSGTSPIQGTGGADNDAVYSGFWAAGVGTNSSIAEAGIFQASGTTRTTLMTYNDGLSINKGASDTLKIDWTLTFGAS